MKRGKYFWDYLLFSEFSRDSTKKNAPFFVFAARKFANLGNYAYLCNVRKDYPGKFPERASRILRVAVLLYLKKSEKSSLLLKENGAVRVRTWLAKKGKPCKREKEALQKGERSLQTGGEVLGNREEGTFWLVATTRPHKLGRAPLRLGAPARLCWSGRQNPTFIPWPCLSLGSTASGGSRAPSTGVDVHPGRGCRDKPWRSHASARCRS